jgi:hypothetical protein
LIGIKEIRIDIRNLGEGNITSALNRSYFLCIEKNELRISENKPITVVDNNFIITLPMNIDENLLQPIKDVITWPAGITVENNILAGILKINIQGGGGLSRIDSYYNDKPQIQISKWIEYIYVSKDCTISGSAFNQRINDYERHEGRSFSIKLLRGWNAIMTTETAKDSDLWEISPVYPLDEEPRWSIYLKF